MKTVHNAASCCLLGLCLLFGLRLRAEGPALQAYPEFVRPDPFGGVVKADRPAEEAHPSLYNRREAVTLKGARGGYVSFHLVVRAERGQGYTLDIQFPSQKNPLQADVSREWFHFLDSDKTYYPDALIPVKLPYSSRLPEPDNQIEGQTAQAFWVDIWVPPGAIPGLYRARATLHNGGRRVVLPFEVKVLAAVVPDQDVIVVDHNSYGSSWLADSYPKIAGRVSDFYSSDDLFRLIHAYHRIFYEHRGVFHQLGYGHGGKVGPEFAPALEGWGRRKHVSSWDLYDRHYGPLFDGSAFAGSRRGVRPIPFVYLPINPEWPASFLAWDEPGYEAEFVNVVSEMERHFREKGWTKTRFELFFNQKKRYKGFPWDGDEVRFARDNQYFVEFSRLLKKSLTRDTPVQFVARADVSWDMEQQFKELKGVIRMWVCAGSILSWYKFAPGMLRNRGDIVWYYGGPPSVDEPSSSNTKFAFQAWLWGVDGFVHWLAVDPGEDPWFHFQGGGTALVYPGEKFGLEEPIPSIRLRIQRNCLQDLALLDGFKTRRPPGALKAEAARRYNHSTPEEWWNPRPAMADLPSDQWSGAGIDDATSRTTSMLAAIRPEAWANVHDFIMQLAAETP